MRRKLIFFGGLPAVAVAAHFNKFEWEMECINWGHV